MGDRRERGGRASAFFRSLEAHSGDYGTRESGKRGRSPTRAVDQSQVRQAPSSASEAGIFQRYRAWCEIDLLLGLEVMTQGPDDRGEGDILWQGIETEQVYFQ